MNKKKNSAVKWAMLFVTSVVICGCISFDQEKQKQEHLQEKVAHHMSRHTTNTELAYEILQEGTGDKPKAGDTVTVHYTGWLQENGKPGAKFDSSVDRGRPFQFKIGIEQVIKGWDEGVMDMKIGEKRRLIIPASLGYGARGAGALIPPHATLIFDVELIAVQ